MSKSNLQIITLLLILLLAQLGKSQGCQPCYDQNEQKNCQADQNNIESYTLHMSVHPHLDAFWIFDFQSYYNPDPNQGNVRGYFASNRFHSVKQIFDTTLEVLSSSKNFREAEGAATQKAHRSFFNSEMGFFKRWYFEQPIEKRRKVQELLKTKYWQIVGGAYVEHDQGCAYYDDIIENFQVGLRFLKEQIGYYPRAAVSADSFGHSSSTLAILAHMGVQGFFVQRSDQHILLKNKTEFIWKAKSANGHYYGALPTHIRWAIHGFEDQFIGGPNNQQQFCQTKAPYINNMNRQNQFLKRILKSNHIMRYFGHDFQKFDDYSYSVMEGIMEKFSLQSCKKVNAVYSNPTEYFMILMGEVFGKVKPIATREEDIMPIWDYDSGLYWTGYYTTDPLHKKQYRDAGRFLYAARKAFTPAYIADPNSQNHKQSYKQLQQLSETVAYLQHHDGISGTSKYEVMDKYQKLAQQQIAKIKKSVLQEMFQVQYPNNTNNPIFECYLESECFMPKNVSNDVYLKVFKTGGVRVGEPIVVHLEEDQFYEPDCQYEIVCLCTGYPCPCDLYLYPSLTTYSLIKLKRVQNRPKDAYLLREMSKQESDILSYNTTHVTLAHNNKQYKIGYKKLNGDPTNRNYAHLSRYGDQVQRSFSIRSGKYALGNNLKTEATLSTIRKVLKLQTDFLTKYIIIWVRQQMKTIITIPKIKANQWKVQTISSAQTGKLQDLYLQINAPHIKNNKKFYTDSNGWLVMKRQLFKHEDYEAHFGPEGYDDVDGNSYPMTAFVYLCDEDGRNKVSINTDRPQGVIAMRQGTIWVNYDRLSSDDGKWVYENTYRSQFQRYVHYVTVDNEDNNERNIQKLYDEPLLIQGNQVASNERVSLQEYKISPVRAKWEAKTGIDQVKFQVKPWNDTSLLLRVFNMKDNEEVTIQLFSADKICTFLTAYYGNQIKFGQVYESNMGGNIRYEEFLNKKWNWNKVVNLTKQNQIFNKKFGETILLRPLQIRTFVFQGIRMDTEECKKIDQLKYGLQKKSYEMDLNKPMPTRANEDKENQLKLAEYLLGGEHCKKRSPITDLTQAKVLAKDPKTDFIALSHMLVPVSPGYRPQLQTQPQTQRTNIPSFPGTTVPHAGGTTTRPQTQTQWPQRPQLQPQPQWPPPQPQPQQQTTSPYTPQHQPIISQLISQYKPLTKDQKQKYFNDKVQLIKKMKAEAAKLESSS